MITFLAAAVCMHAILFHHKSVIGSGYDYKSLSSDSLYALSSIHDTITANGSTVNQYNVTLQSFRNARIKSADYDDLDLFSLRQKTSDGLTNSLFEPRRDALKKLVENAQTAAVRYDWRKDVRNVTFVNSSSFLIHYDPDAVDERANVFRKKVNFTFSTVHVPVETYIGVNSVEQATLKGIDWTNQLDEFFKEAEEEARNSTDQEDLLWQYFGSREGFVRHYPGSEWTKNGEVDLYDSRRRPWYNSAASSPKDVLIMIDTSGSTAGQTLYLMTLTVQKLMDTLSEDDFVQVANFSDATRMGWGNARIGPKCFPSFVQATTFNKRVLMDHVKLLNHPNVSRGQANFDVAMNYSYRTFEEFEKSRERENIGRGANCSKIIIILTDGGIEKPTTLKYEHDKDNKYRVFTYAMGQTPTPLDAVRWLACNNKGYFSSINSLGTINAGVQHFSNRLSAVMAHSKGQDSLLSSIYRDEWGLGMLTTLTMPVFNHTDKDNITLLGIMGIDIAVAEFDNFIPFRQLGPLAYTVVVNHNGFVIKHPALKTQELWNIEPSSIDFLDAEVVKNEEDIQKLNEVREILLKKEKKQPSVGAAVGVVLQNGVDNHAYFVSYSSTEYYCTDVAKTAYRMAMVHPNIINHVLKVTYSADAEKPNVTIFEELAVPTLDYDITVSRWIYCKGLFKLSNATTVLAVLTNLINDTSVTCDEDMVNHLLWDASIIKSLELNKFVDGGGAESVSLTTGGGLSVLYPSPEDGNVRFRFENHYNDPATKRAFANSEEYVYSAVYSPGRVSVAENTTGPRITIYKAIDDVGTEKYIFGVLGITINNTALTDALLAVEDTSGERLCESSTANRCYLLDEGGFILSENGLAEGYSYVGNWLGIVDPSLMHALYNDTDGKAGDSAVFHRHKYYDYQATCVYDWLAESSSAPALPSLGQLADMVLTQLSASLLVLYNSMWTYSAIAAEPELSYGQRYEICTKISHQYYYNDNPGADLNKTIDYSSADCYRMAQTVKIPGTNMLLVIADPPSSSCDDMPALPQAPVTIERADYETEDPSMCMQHTRRRVRPKECYDTDKTDFMYSCEGCRQTTFSMVLIFTATTLCLLLS